MEEFKGTKAPWYFDRNCQIWTGNERLKENGGYIIADLHGPDKTINGELCAAAPLLLQSLQKAIVFMQQWAQTPEEIELLTDCKYALNKALKL